MIGITRSKYYSWSRRYGMKNNHNSSIPRWFWLQQWEKDAIIAFHREHPLEGYRRLAYMMIDADVVAVSPSSVYRVLKARQLLGKAPDRSSSKGEGFDHPTGPHQHWHMDVSYVNICGTFYYLCGILDGYSRFVVHWEIREQMKARDTEIILQRGHEKYPSLCPRIITDNGPQFIARDFKEFIRLCGMTHVRTSPFYPQSNGKYESFNKCVKRECIRPQTPLSLQDARRVLGGFVEHYNTERLHSGIGYIAPLDKLEGRAEHIITQRTEKLAAARKRRRESHERQQNLTDEKKQGTTQMTGETEAGSAGKQPARVSRSDKRQKIA